MRAGIGRAAVPLVAALVVAGSVLGASGVPVQFPAPVIAADDDRARLAVVCPTVADLPSGIAAYSLGGGVQPAPLGDPGSPIGSPAASYADLGASAPLVVSAPRRDPFSATTRTASSQGADRGLSMASCPRPSSSQWFAGVDSSAAGVAELVLLNADAQDAAVDVAVYGPQGRLAAPGSRGIVVAARSSRVVPLGPLFSAAQPVSLQVSTSAGRVAAMVRQRVLRGDRTAGADWLPPTTEPASAVVIPGLPSGKGRRDLVVVNPGERTASVALQVLGADGASAVLGLETLQLPPGTSRVVPLGRVLAEAPVGLRLISEQKVTAAVIADNGGDAEASDISTQVATTPLAGPGVLALTPGQRTAPVLHLAAAGTDPVGVRVLVRAARGGKTLLDRLVNVPGSADVTVALPAAADVLVTLEPRTASPVHASVAVRVPLGKVAGVASLAVPGGLAAVELPPVRHDPRLGS